MNGIRIRYWALLPVSMIWGLFEWGEYIFSAHLDKSVSWIFRNMVCSNLSGSTISAVVMSAEDVVWLSLLTIISGNIISDDFSHGAIYSFSRVSNRTLWAWKKLLNLWEYAAAYTILYLVSALVLAGKVSGMPFTFDDFGACLWIFVGYSLLAFLAVIITNMLCVYCGTSNAFLWFHAGLIALLIQLLTGDNGILDFLNPMRITVSGSQSDVYQIGKIIYLLVLVVVSGRAFKQMTCRRDFI